MYVVRVKTDQLSQELRICPRGQGGVPVFSVDNVGRIGMEKLEDFVTKLMGALVPEKLCLSCEIPDTTILVL